MGRAVGLLIITVALAIPITSFILRFPPRGVYEFAASYVFPLSLLYVGHAFFVGKIDLQQPRFPVVATSEQEQ